MIHLRRDTSGKLLLTALWGIAGGAGLNSDARKRKGSNVDKKCS